MAMIMEKILRYFPLNKGIEAKSGKTLAKVIGKYIALWIGSYIVIQFLGRVPLIGNLLYRVFWVGEYYVLVGMALGCYQYFSGKDFSSVIYIGKEDFKRWWSYKQCKIAVVAIALILALIPHGDKTTVNQSTNMVNQNGGSDTTGEEQDDQSTIAGADLAETEEEEAEEDEPVVSQEQLDLYEDIKGFWKGDGIQYTFSRQQDQYYFIDSDSLGDKLMNENFYIAYYSVDSYQKSDDKVKAVLSDQDDRKYDVELSTTANGKRMLKIRREDQAEWVPLTDNTLYSYQEVFDVDEYKALWLEQPSWLRPYIAWMTIDNNWSYCFLDVIDQHEGDELLIRDNSYQSHHYYAMGITDGFVQPLYEMYSYLDKEYYDSENKIFWTYYYGGTSGGSQYNKVEYDEENGGWQTVEQGLDDISDGYEKIFFCEFGKDYETAYHEELERLAQEEKEKADAAIVFDESLAITEPIESYVGEYYNQTFGVEINTIDEDSCSLKIVSGIHAVGLGRRVKEGFPDGVVVYSVAGIVVTDNHGNSANSDYAIMLVLKPDGSIFIGNISALNPTFKFPRGTYRTNED